MAILREELPDDLIVHYVSARKKRGKGQANKAMQPPLTPMIDVVFQLLLFFLLGCDFRMSEAQIHTKLPSLEAPPDMVNPEAIAVLLAPAGEDGVEIAIEGEADAIRSFEELYGFLVKRGQQLGAGATERVPVSIKPTVDVTYGDAANAFWQATRAKYKKVTFVPSQS